MVSPSTLNLEMPPPPFIPRFNPEKKGAEATISKSNTVVKSNGSDVVVLTDI